MKLINTFGAELEKPVSNKTTAGSHGVSQKFFKRLKNFADKRASKPHYHFSDIKPKVVLGIVSKDLGEQGLDNGFNLLETSLPYQKSLSDLQKLIEIDLKTTQKALEAEGATIINMSIHPLGKRDLKTYKRLAAPKGIYQYIWYRGWKHSAGIDARAQNSPTTGVGVREAADAVSVIIGAGAAIIALFANGPFEGGKLSKYKDARLNMWDEMMGQSKAKGDLATTKFPPRRFNNLTQYFNWMFGSGTQIYFVLARNNNSSGYKSIGDQILIPKGKLSVLQYLSKKSWPAFWFKEINKKNPKTEIITPNISDLEILQYTQFAGARIRFKLKNHDEFPLKDFLTACKKNNNKVEEILENFSEYFYIEGRDPGTNFPDEEITSAGGDIAKSVVIAPSALQAGLLNNLSKVSTYLQKYSWEQLSKLRKAALQNGFKGKVDNLSVEEFTKDILNLASEGLGKQEQWMLSYPKWVLQTKQNGADRALNFVKNHKKDSENAIVDLIKNREIVL